MSLRPRALGIDANWLFFGKKPENSVSNAETNSSDFIPIKRLNVEASAAHGGTAQAAELGSGFYAFNKKWLDLRGLTPNHLSVISVRGDSMEPSLWNNDLILIDHAQDTPKDGLVFAVRYSGDIFVKHIQRLPDNKLQLFSANKIYTPITIHPDESNDFKVIGRVVASMHEW